LKWLLIVGSIRPNESLKPSCRKETIKEAATIVQARHPPSGCEVGVEILVLSFSSFFLSSVLVSLSKSVFVDLTDFN
jgi:hypothetical protein